MKLSPITKDQFLKIVKAAAYVGASAIISYITTLILNDPQAFGYLTPFVNILLVSLKQALTDGQAN